MGYKEEVYVNTVNELTDDYIENHYDEIKWSHCVRLPGFNEFIDGNSDEEKLYWVIISMNPNAISVIQKQIKKELLGESKKINWSALSVNPGAVKLLQNLLKNEGFFSQQSTGIYSDKIDWSMLSRNPGAGSLLEKVFKINPEKLDWGFFSNESSCCFNTSMGYE